MNLVRGPWPEQGARITLEADERRRHEAAVIIGRLGTNPYDLDITEHRLWQNGLIQPDESVHDAWPELMPGHNPRGIMVSQKAVAELARLKSLDGYDSAA
jgi:hypothetical protein